MVMMKNNKAPNPNLAACLLKFQWLPLSLLLFNLLSLSDAGVGTAARYNAPYIPTACYGSDTTEFPENNQFAAAGEGIWDNGAACGRQYLVRCISAPPPNSCISGSTIQVKIVDRAATAISHPSAPRATLSLSSAAYSQLVNPPSAGFINIEYQQ
ncbi:hypothetical protein Cgig2_027545 [Carnegiea gigantea]|uniref:Expansin-like EG45 domain-containing protein n=1 Tax=Carnegiea gigantea TaxID=171969 RepID=A0A9Q1JVT9_9CARY|nr:hypothetical protein Cgig2_027545 [Carnegiea gigantea]